ncbi:MAG: hypothetical protein PPHEINF_2019 [uncultured Paraburkholderia sp.]|nr:hypothetical protein BURK_006311 [Burkholderia sp. SJ98]MCS6428093.1 hypothetical protein [Burkholderia thailandensis]CAH2782594.1 MAG: hypothetical protein PPHEINF_2019 [uncultured Paraburkholderia sp.]MCS6467207.1 hypothetical protein [Burkholderia thailandensis]CAH2784026.1 MAG: hypothetical protein PPHEESC_1819 [uncultured Paraburkholderia sp.]
MTSSIQATEEDTTKFLSVLENISQEQKTICALLDELILLMQMPSESVLKVLEGLLLPMGQNMVDLTSELKTQLADEEA